MFYCMFSFTYDRSFMESLRSGDIVTNLYLYGIDLQANAVVLLYYAGGSIQKTTRANIIYALVADVK